MEYSRRETDQERTWWDGNSTRVWRTSLILYIGILSFLAAFIFNKVVEIPGTYPNKAEIAQVKSEILTNLDNIDKKVDDINKYLRDKK